MASQKRELRQRISRGTGNVFADLRVPDAAERQTKLRLAYALHQVLDGRKLSQADAAKVLEVTQAKVSVLRHQVHQTFDRKPGELAALHTPHWRPLARCGGHCQSERSASAG